MELLKICRYCEVEKPLSDFYKDKKNKDGRRGECKQCGSLLNKSYRVLNKKKVKKSYKTHYNGNKEKIIAKNREWLENNKEKQRAHRIVLNAIRTGLLIRPDSCSNPKCESTAKTIEAHHEDYSKPMEVDWLCTSCHIMLHRERGR